MGVTKVGSGIRDHGKASNRSAFPATLIAVAALGLLSGALSSCTQLKPAQQQAQTPIEIPVAEVEPDVPGEEFLAQSFANEQAFASEYIEIKKQCYTRVAAELGLSRQSLYRRMERLGITRGA